jgi:glucokinase
MSKRSYLGIDIGGTNIKLALVSSTGRVLQRGIIETDGDQGPRSAMRRIRTAARSFVGAGVNLTAAGMGCAGLIDAKRGVLLTSPNLPKWKNTPLARIAAQELGVQTYVDNDVNVAAYGEYKCGSGRGYRNLICITLGTGVGGGVVSDGKLLRGTANFAGEIGHMSIHLEGPRCKCGNRGCLEAYVGKNALVRAARAKLKSKKGSILGKLSPYQLRTLTPKMIFLAAQHGDRVAKEVLNDAAEYLGSAVASLVNIFNPDVIAFGGGVSGAFDFMKPRLEKVVQSRAFKAPASMVRLCRSQLGNDASTVGAALLAKDQPAGRRKEAGQ